MNPLRVAVIGAGPAGAAAARASAFSQRKRRHRDSKAGRKVETTEKVEQVEKVGAEKVDKNAPRVVLYPFPPVSASPMPNEHSLMDVLLFFSNFENIIWPNNVFKSNHLKSRHDLVDWIPDFG